MNDIIREILFFGSLMDGFKVYPFSSSSLAKYTVFDNTTEKDYKLQISKSGEYVTYTFIKYGLLTSLTKGRTGSCFGLSIILKGKYFTDPTIFISKICNQIFEALVKEKILLSRNDANGAIGYVAYDLASVSKRLDEWTEIIKHVIIETYSTYLFNINEIKDYTNDEMECISDASPLPVISEKLKTKGRLLLGPNFPIINKTQIELIIEQKNEWESKYNDLKIVSDKQKIEIQALQKELSGVNNNIHQQEINKQEIRKILQPSITHNQQISNIILDKKEEKEETHKKRKTVPSWLPIILGCAAIIIIIILFYTALNSKIEPPIEFNTSFQTTIQSEPRPHPESSKKPVDEPTEINGKEQIIIDVNKNIDNNPYNSIEYERMIKSIREMYAIPKLGEDLNKQILATLNKLLNYYAVQEIEKYAAGSIQNDSLKLMKTKSKLNDKLKLFDWYISQRN